MELYWIVGGLIGVLVAAVFIFRRRRQSESELLPPGDESANLSTRTWVPHEDAEDDQRTSGA
jgi:hypothetical protein